MKSLVNIALVWLFMALPLSAAAQEVPSEGEAEGEIHALNFARSTIVIQGGEYAVSPMVQVEIGGTYGAFTMLQPGMMVEYLFHRYSDGRRVIFEIKEIRGREPVLL